MRHLPLILLGLLLLWAPLPFGSVTPWGVLLIVALVAALTLTVSAARQGLFLDGVGGVTVGLLGLGLLGMVQASALAGRWLGFLTTGLEAQLPSELSAAIEPSLSLAPALSRQAALGWWTLALLFIAAAVVARQGQAKHWLLGAVLASTAFQILYGWRQLRTNSHEILGRGVPGPPRLRGTLVNADHLAVLFEIVMAICLAWGWWAWYRSRREPRLVYRMAWLLPPLVCWSGSAAALLGTGSRAALAAAVFGLVVQSALLFGPRRQWWVPAVVSSLVVAAALVLVSRGPTPELGRQLSRPTHEILRNSRFEVWEPALRLWKASPWLGTGLGTFEEAFPRVQPASLMKDRWGRAHNDPLELLVTGGLLAVGFLGWALYCLVRRLWLVYHSGARVAGRAAALAALAALPPVALHEGADFGLTIPVNAVFMVVLLGVGASGPTAQEEGAAPLRSR